MDLNTQVISLLVSFLYGVFFFITLFISKKLIYHKIFLIKILSNFVFVSIHIFIYFYILIKINNGILHIYEILCIIIGYIISYYLHKYLQSIL